LFVATWRSYPNVAVAESLTTMLAKLLLLGLLAYVVWRLVFASRATARSQSPQRNRPEPERMEKCAGCGVYVPARALGRDGRCGACR